MIGKINAGYCISLNNENEIVLEKFDKNKVYSENTIKITRKEMLIIQQLRFSVSVKTNRLIARVYGYPAEIKEIEFSESYQEYQAKSLRVHICKLKKKIKPLGLKIIVPKKYHYKLI